MTPLPGSWCAWVVPGRVGPPGHSLRATLRELGIEETALGVRRAGSGLVLLDEDCPFTTPHALHAVAAAALATAACAIGVRPVTDTVKHLHEGELGETVDREGLVAVAAPLAVPPGLHVELVDGPLPGVVARLRAAHHVGFVDVDASSRRVADASDLAVLSALAGAQA